MRQLMEMSVLKYLWISSRLIQFNVLGSSTGMSVFFTREFWKLAAEQVESCCRLCFIWREWGSGGVFWYDCQLFGDFNTNYFYMEYLSQVITKHIVLQIWRRHIKDKKMHCSLVVRTGHRFFLSSSLRFHHYGRNPHALALFALLLGP
jgi:hypothetical protein